MASKKRETEVADAFAARLVDAAAAAEESRQAACDALAGGAKPNTTALWADMAAVFGVVADFAAPTIHTKRFWRLFDLSERLAVLIIREREHVLDWQSQLCDWRLLNAWRDVLVAAAEQATWQEPGPRHLNLESVAELREQKCSDLQIARIHTELLRPDGTIDRDKMRRVLAGELELTGERILPPAWPSGWPVSAPVVAAACHLGQWLRSELSDEIEAADAPPYELV
jgi:hypothetical protein